MLQITFLSITILSVSMVGSVENGIKEIDFRGVKEGVEMGSLWLLDVRTPAELEEVGKIPTAINIPIAELENAFTKISAKEFQSKYGFDRTSPGKPVVFYCRSGKRAKDAIDKLKSLNVKLDYILYKGSMIDWVAKGGPIEK